MSVKSNLDELCRRILEEKGGEIADKAKTMLLQESGLDELKDPLEYTANYWRDPLTPSLVILSCEAVGGELNDATYQTALAVTLMSLTFNLWDDIVDKTVYKKFVPTVLGKYGEGTTLIIGGLASAKAFSILSAIRLEDKKRQSIMKLIWDYWVKLAKAEVKNATLKKRGAVNSEEKLKVIEMQSVNLETAMKVGATLGNASEEEMRHLGNYGRYLSMILELRKDFNVSLNLTLELAEKIRSGALTYTLLWAKEHSEKVKHYLTHFKNTVKPEDIKKLVELIIEARALENIKNLIVRLTHNAKLELLKIKNRKKIGMLKFFLESQPKIFDEIFSSLL